MLALQQQRRMTDCEKLGLGLHAKLFISVAEEALSRNAIQIKWQHL